ncbi:hypothetical protein ACPYO6_15840 [Georgenia sp. Z1344]|uniref:hypothetical protein n=1 Tax=Georgenia sp. Z1344 TaxID=3416706 RepID=UPI003CF8CF82
MRAAAVALGAAALGAGVSAAARRLLERRPPGGADVWTRTNHAGDPVSLLGGLAAGAAVTGIGPLLAPCTPVGPRLALAATAAGGAATAAGVLDDHGEDLTGVPTGRAKGLTGHLGALARGEVTTGALKIAVVGAGASAAALLLPGPRPLIGRLADAALVAGCANLANLFDLRPGRALKVAGIALAPVALAPVVLGPDAAGSTAPRSTAAARATDAAAGRATLAAGALGVIGATLPADLAARDMLGDTGANPLGAIVGVVLAADPSAALRGIALCAVVGLTLASERISFTAVIDSVPVLRAIDRAGRAA